MYQGWYIVLTFGEEAETISATKKGLSDPFSMGVP